MRAKEAVADNGSELTGTAVEISVLGQALADPIRVRMLGMMAEGRRCCGFPESALAVIADNPPSTGICVCEFVEYFGMGQSKVSYHLGKLKQAGLVEEARRGKWRYYSVRKESARKMLAILGKHLDVDCEN